MRAEGHTGLRVYAETRFLLDHPDALVAWPGYELRADLLFKRIPMTAVCAYDARRWAPRDWPAADHRDGTTRVRFRFTP